jgi:enamine deaminase RidA (YjgF/YER057c/UK114 family)
VVSDRYELASNGWYDRLPGAPAVRVGELVFVAGQLALDRELRGLHRGDVVAQAHAVLASLAELLEAAGGSLDDVLDVVSYHRDAREIPAVLEVAREYFSTDPPAWTPVATTGLMSSEALVAVRAIGHVGDAAKHCYPASAEPFPMSAACARGELLFVSGQTAAAEDGSVPAPADHVSQARVAYRRILELAARAGASVDDALDFASFHQDIRGAEATFADVYEPEVLGAVDPASAPTTSHIGMPALRSAGMLGTYRTLFDLSPGDRVGSTPDGIWWKGVLPITGGVRKRAGRLLTIAGQVACDSDATVVAPGNFEGQARYILDCIREIVEQAGGSMADIVEVTSYHKEPRSWEIVAEVARDYFDPTGGPAWTVAGASGLWWEGYLHEISALAVLGRPA